MNIVAFAIRRRVTIAMMTVAILVFGFVSQSRLSLNLLPELSYPTITVRTALEGAAPQEIESLISKPIEEVVGVIKGVRRVQSISRSGQSDVLLEFAWGTDMDMAGVDIRDRLDVLNLPLDAERPVLLRFDPSSEPVMRYGFSIDDSKLKTPISAEDKLKQLRRYSDEQLKKDLEAIEGVAAVKASGGLEDEIQILVDQNKLSQLQIPIDVVAARLRAENVNLSGGRLEEGSQEFLVRTVNEFETVEAMNDAIITVLDGRNIYLRDIATVRRGYKEREAITRINGVEAVEVALYKEGDANTVSVANAIEARMQTIQRKLPPQYTLTKVYDQSVFISQAIDEVVNAAWFGGLLAALIIYFFLRNFRATVIISVSIPVSVIATFIMMYFNGISLNIMSLGGIALAVGMLVDNAIVVLENIQRHREMGETQLQAAESGTSEVATAIIASTLTTIAVFFPLVFVQGIAGQLFSDQSLTVTFALLFSLIIALTLIPMLSALKASSNEAPASNEKPIGNLWQSIRHPGGIAGIFRIPVLLIGLLIASVYYLVSALLVMVGRVFSFIGYHLLRWPVHYFNSAFSRLDAWYQKLLASALEHRGRVLTTAFLMFAGSLALIPVLGVELIPQMSQGEYYAEIKLPPGAPLEQTDETILKIDDALRQQENIENTYSVAGTGNRLDANPADSGENSGTLSVTMKDGANRADEEYSIARLRNMMASIPGIEFKFGRPELFSFETPLEIEISGFDLDKLRTVSQQVTHKLSESDRFTDIKNSMQIGHPEVQILFDQERAAQIGMNVSDIAKTVVSKIRGDVATRYTWRDRKIDVLIRAQEDQRASVEEIGRLIVNPASDRPVPLSAVADIVVGEGPAEIRRISQERVALISANLNYGDLGTAVEEVNRMLDSITLPTGIVAHVTGQSEDMKVAFESMQFALILAIFLVYLVMASQFESLLHPFVILFTIPLALTGAVLALFITGTTISVVVFIGLIMLAGIVVNNAIVLIDMINQLRASGMEKIAAIREAGRARLRPIVMTTLTTVLGLAPMAIGLGEGAEIRTPMAITVIGGLLFSTLLTLLVIPVMYAIIDRKEIVAEPARSH